MSKNSNLNRIFHALRAYHGRRFTRRQYKRMAVDTAREYPWFHRYSDGVDTAPWLG